MSKLYLKIEQLFETIEDVLLFMFPYGSTYCTKKTYFDEECTKLQGFWYRRSINDLYIICQTYFSEASKLEILKAIENCKLNFYICFDVKKLVFHRVFNRSIFNLENIIKECVEKCSDYLNNNLDVKLTVLEIIELLESKNEKKCLEKDFLEQEVE